MSLSELSSIGGFISDIAVLVSLLYLSRQLRQADRNQRATIQQGRATRSSEFSMFTANPEIAKVWTKARLGDQTLTEVEFQQFLAILRATLNNMEDAYFQHRSRALEDDAFESSEAILSSLLAVPGIRAAWPIAAFGFNPSFRDYINHIVERTPVAPPDDTLAEWKASVAAHTAAAAASVR
jgi:hypothetical protein